MAVSQQGVADKMVFRRTHEHSGRHISITPANSCMQHLAYGRIVLNSGTAIASFSTGDHKTGLICLSGRAVVTVDQKEVEIGQYDAVYIPRDSAVSIAADTNVDIAEISSDVANHYPLQVVRAAEMSRDPNWITAPAGQDAHVTSSCRWAKIFRLADSSRESPRPNRETGPVGRRTSMPRCSKRSIFISTCLPRRMASNSFIAITKNPNW